MMLAIRRSIGLCQCAVVRRTTFRLLAADPTSGRCCSDTYPAVRRLSSVESGQRWQTTLSDDRRGTSVAELRSQLYAVASPRGKRAAAAYDKARKVANITQAVPAAVATSDSVHDIAKLCALLARAQPRRRRGGGVRLKGRRWYDAALDRCLVLLRPPLPLQHNGRTLATLAHTLSLLPMQFNARDVELVHVLAHHVAASATDALEREAQVSSGTNAWDQKDVAMVMRALAKLSVRHEPAMLALTRLTSHMEPSLSPRATVTILWSLATLDCVEEPYTAVVDRLGKRFSTAAAQQVRNAGGSQHARQFRNDENDDGRRHSPGGKHNKRHSSNSRRPRSAIGEHGTATTASSESQWASLHTAVMVAWSLTVLDRLSFPVLRSVFAVIAAVQARGELKKGVVNEIVLCQLHQVFLAIDLGHVYKPSSISCGSSGARRRRPLATMSEDGHNGCSERKTESTVCNRILVPSQLAERCRTTFRRITTKVGRSSQFSPTAASVEKALAMARPECHVKREQVLRDCGYSVDLLLRQERIAVEVDGKVHYCRRGPWEEEPWLRQNVNVPNGSEMNTEKSAGRPTTSSTSGRSELSPLTDTLPLRKLGRTVLKHRQIEAKGWRVVSVPWWEWESLSEHGGARVSYLARKIWGVKTENVEEWLR